MFQLEMIRQIVLKCKNGYGSEGIRNIALYKTIELSFAPSLGLSIIDKGRQLLIKDLCWNNDFKRFIALFDEEWTTSETKEQWLRFDKDNGWEE